MVDVNYCKITDDVSLHPTSSPSRDPSAHPSSSSPSLDPTSNSSSTQTQPPSSAPPQNDGLVDDDAAAEGSVSTTPVASNPNKANDVSAEGGSVTVAVVLGILLSVCCVTLVGLIFVKNRKAAEKRKCKMEQNENYKRNVADELVKELTTITMAEVERESDSDQNANEELYDTIPATPRDEAEELYDADHVTPTIQNIGVNVMPATQNDAAGGSPYEGIAVMPKDEGDACRIQERDVVDTDLGEERTAGANAIITAGDDV